MHSTAVLEKFPLMNVRIKWVSSGNFQREGKILTLKTYRRELPAFEVVERRAVCKTKGTKLFISDFLSKDNTRRPFLVRCTFAVLQVYVSKN